MSVSSAILTTKRGLAFASLCKVVEDHLQGSLTNRILSDTTCGRMLLSLKLDGVEALKDAEDEADGLVLARYTQLKVFIAM